MRCLMKPICCGMLVFAASFLAGDQTAGAADHELRTELKVLAKSIKKVMDSRNQSAVALGDVVGPGALQTSSGPGIVQILTDELQLLGVRIGQKASVHRIHGRYQLTEIPASEPGGGPLLGLKLKIFLTDHFGRGIPDGEFERTIHSEDTIAELIGTSVVLPAAAVQEDRHRRLETAITNPAVHVGGTMARAEGSDPYGIEIFVGNEPARLSARDGVAFVEIPRGESYSVRLINASNIEAAVQLTIDGLNMFTFSEERILQGPSAGSPRFSTIIIAPNSSTVVRGWYRDANRSDKFLVAGYAESAAAHLNQPADVGTITASFHAAWTGAARPPDEAPGTKSLDSSTQAGTAIGEPVETKYRTIERKVGKTRAVVSIRYSR